MVLLQWYVRVGLHVRSARAKAFGKGKATSAALDPSVCFWQAKKIKNREEIESCSRNF